MKLVDCCIRACPPLWLFRHCGCLLLLLLLAVTPALANTYYVATNGGDTNNGTSLNTPFKTLQKAAQVAGAGDTCYIRGGVYRETLKPANSGTQGASIVFAAYSNEVVTVSGCDVVTNWTQHSGNIYKATMGWDLGAGFNQVFVDGAMMCQSRYPNMTATNSLMKPALIAVTESAANTNQITSAALNQANGFWTNCYFVGRIGFSWTWQWGHITSSTSGSVTVTSNSYPWFPGTVNGGGYTGAGYILGNLASLDAAKEWHYQTNTIFLWTPAGDNPNSHLVEAKRRAWTVDMNGKFYITVRGLRLVGGAVNMNSAHCVVTDCEASYMSHFVLFSWPGWNNAGQANNGHQGIYINGFSNTVSRCNIHDTAGCGVAFSGSSYGNSVSHCAIYNISYGGTYGNPVYLAGRANRVWFNTIYNAGRDCIVPTGANHDIRFNDLSFPGLLCYDVGILYAFDVDAKGTEPTATRIAYNWVHDNTGQSGLNPGIYLDNYCRHFRVDHNVVWNCIGDAGVRINGPDYGHVIYNNTLFYCDDVGTHTFMSPPPHAGGWDSNDTVHAYAATNNLHLPGGPGTQLMNFAQRDFSLRPGVAAINTGVVVPGYTDGHFGSAPDKGAYEYGAFNWTAGTNGAVGISLQRTGTNFILNCPVGTLLQATNVTGPWAAVPGGAMPYTVTPVAGNKYYRVQVE